MLRRSLRARLTLAIALTSLALSAGISFAVYELTKSQVLDAARSAEAARVNVVTRLFQHTGQVALGARRDDTGAPGPLRDAVAQGLLGTYIQGSTVWAGTPLAGGHSIFVANSIAPELSALSNLRETLALVTAAAIVLSMAGGVFQARRLSGGLRAAAAVADRVSHGELDARVNAGGADEVARLGHAIDQMTQALSERIVREQRFAADVAHELRTPLTALVTAGALLDDSRPAQVIRERVGALRTLVEDLLEISRLQAGSEHVQLECVELGRLLAATVAERAPDAELELARDAVVRTDRRRLERVIGNLLDNASRHGAPPIRVLLDAPRIVVSDSGPGYPDELLQGGPSPFRTGDASRGAGSGLGLMIALGQAQTLGAELAFANGPHGGARATLGLSDAHVSQTSSIPESAAAQT